MRAGARAAKLGRHRRDPDGERRRTNREGPETRRGATRPRRRAPDDRPGRQARPHRRLPQGGCARADPAGGLPLPREDHALRPRAHPGAGRARPRLGAHGFFQVYDDALATYTAGPVPRPTRTCRRRCSCGSRPCRLARLGRHAARRARLRDQVLHRGGQLRPRRQQHAGLLHPGRHQVPRPRPRRQARAAPRDAAGARRRTTRSGTSSRCSPRRCTCDVADVGPGAPAQLPHDGGLRRAHVPAGQRRRRRRRS